MADKLAFTSAAVAVFEEQCDVAGVPQLHIEIKKKSKEKQKNKKKPQQQQKKPNPVGFHKPHAHALKTRRDIYVPQTYCIWTNLDKKAFTKYKELLDKNSIPQLYHIKSWDISPDALYCIFTLFLLPVKYLTSSLGPQGEQSTTLIPRLTFSVVLLIYSITVVSL